MELAERLGKMTGPDDEGFFLGLRIKIEVNVSLPKLVCHQVALKIVHTCNMQKRILFVKGWGKTLRTLCV